MIDRFAAQKELHATVLDIHRSIALSVLQGAGLEVGHWQDLASHTNQAGEVLWKLILANQDLVITDIQYDGGERPTDAKPQYPVALAGYKAISLMGSATPWRIFENIEFENLDWAGQKFQEIDHPAKFISLELIAPDKTTTSAFVLLGNDMPPTMVFEDDLRQIGESATDEGVNVIAAVEKAFGPEAPITLSDEACIALAGALRTAQPTVLA